MIKASQVIYNDVKYKSQTKAKMAIFFETEGFSRSSNSCILIGKEVPMSRIETKRSEIWLVLLLAAVFCLPGVGRAQGYFSASELDTLVANIALYPDPLLVQVVQAQDLYIRPGLIFRKMPDLGDFAAAGHTDLQHFSKPPVKTVFPFSAAAPPR